MTVFGLLSDWRLSYLKNLQFNIQLFVGNVCSSGEHRDEAKQLDSMLLKQVNCTNQTLDLQRKLICGDMELVQQQ